MSKFLTQRNVQRIIDKNLYDKFGFNYESSDDLERVKFVATELNKIQDEQDNLRGLVTEAQRKTSNRFYYQINGVSLESIGNNYEPKYFQPNEDISDKPYSPDLSQRGQDSEKNDSIEDSTIWSNEHQINVLLMTGTQTTNGMIRILGNTTNWNEKTGSTIGIYDTNTKTHILSSFLSNPTCELFEVTESIKKQIKRYQKGLIGFNQPELLEPILEKILEQSNGTHLNREWFEDNGFVDFLNNIRYTDVTIHITKCNPSQTKLLYNTLATVQKEQSDLNLLSGDLNTYFGKELYVGLGNGIRRRLFNNFKGLSEPLFVMNTSFYNSVYKENQGTGYDSKDKYFLEMLPLYFFDLDCGKFDYDRVPSFNNKFGELLWGVGKKKKFGHIKDCFEYINSLKGDERTKIITEWRNLILELHQLWTYIGEEVEKYELISTPSGILAKKIKPKLVNDYNLGIKESPLNKTNISKLYDMNNDGSFPMTSILLNTYSFIKRTTNLNVIHGKTIFSLIPKYYTENYCEFLSNPQMTKHLLENNLQTTWLDKNPNKSLSSALNVLYEISGEGESIGSDGILHIHNQFYKKVLETKVSNDPIFKAMASEQKTKAIFLTNCEKVGINHQENPILMTTHGLVRNYGNVSDKEYLNIGHFTMKKDGGLVYVLKSDDDNEIDELRFLPENVDANQYKEKKVPKDYHLWWDKQIRYNNYLVWKSYQAAKGDYYDEKQIEGDGSKFYYTHNIEDSDGEERMYLEYKNSQYMQNNLRLVVGFMHGVDWNGLKNYQDIDYIIKEEKEQELEMV
jgi:hypothetical protein